MSALLTEIRRALPGDAAQIAEVHDVTWRQAYGGMLPHRALDRMVRRRDEGWWVRAIRHSAIVLVTQVGERIAGYASLGPNRLKSLAPEGEIYEIYLLPEYQGVGLGTGLLLDARKELRRLKLKGAVVWVLAENILASRFYENAGGRKIAESYERFDGEKILKTAYSWR
jgi:ribosomal protein S18 acetylase RimI-like enzyme